ncbi:DMP19 family protein [Solirubrobacter phytolaccae]|uniref:DMP19 family protein n=1 Tax=Solirubrobacter phytolaccae TaxID=1404360 RepID=A0A9X3SCS0_9ACTN|nr:DUF4375 domain-containing protein [Solirubrobacter phytolaccae]MDA0182840.1 DMP19 family protein [Solirubrobacter phytolaccae]
MKRALVLLVLLAALGGCGGIPEPAVEEGAAAEASGWPAEMTPEPGFDPDDPALDTIPDDGAHGEEITRKAGTRKDFKVPPAAVAGLDNGPLVRAVVTRPFYELDPEDAVDRLNAAQLAVYAFYYADFEILNGGFTQFWSNPSGAVAADLQSAAERVGSPEFAAIFRDAAALWPGGKIPRDAEQRGALVDQLDATKVAELDEIYAATQYRRNTALANVLGPFIRANTDQFVASR